MSDDRRVYSDEEFALILRKAAELASGTDRPAPSVSGLTLSEMKAAAAQVGLDPVFVERAARLVSASTPASLLERLTGGPLRHEHHAHFPGTLDESTAARLLSAVRISAGQAGNTDSGHSSAMGMTWHDGGDAEALHVTARPGEHGTSVSVGLDRRGTLGLVATASGVAIFFTILFSGSALYPESHALGIGGAIAGIGGILAAARGYWASSTRRVRERISGAMDTVAETLTPADAPPPDQP